MKDQEQIQFVSLKNIPKLPGVGFFFTTRQGGYSNGSYGGLNLGLHVGDDPRLVKKNRQAVLNTLAPEVEELVLVNQVHGTTTLEVPFASEKCPDADALVTTRKKTIIGVMTADCLPILLADVDGAVIGAAHAGWRGAAAGVLDSCIDAMVGLGAKSERIKAIIGPGIRVANYAVGDSFPEQLSKFSKNKTGFDYQKFFSSGDKKVTLLFDLPGYVRERLIWNDIPAVNIYDVGLCTYLNDNQFFSHRRTTTQQGVGHCGRQMGGIYLC